MAKRPISVFATDEEIKERTPKLIKALKRKRAKAGTKTKVFEKGESKYQVGVKESEFPKEVYKNKYSRNIPKKKK